MSSLTQSVEIDAAKDEVWEVLADLGTVSRWAPTITESAMIGDASEGVGAVRTCEHVKMGTLEETVVSWSEGEAYAYDVTAGLPFPMKALRNNWSVDEQGSRTKVTLHQEFSTKLGPLGSLMESMMLKRMMRKEMRLALAGLEYHIETGSIATTDIDLPLANVN